MTIKTAPVICGILPTYNRAQYLPRVLESFRHQSLDRSEFEIVIVDDGSSDESPAILKRFESEMANVRIIRQDHAGIAAAKNLALAASSAPIILFLDDDDVADRDLFGQHIEAHHAFPDKTYAILGHTALDDAIKDIPLMHHVVEVGYQLFAYPLLKPNETYGFREFWGGRSSCKRALLGQERFNPTFKFGCEDMELAWRLQRSGLKVVFCPDARTRMLRQISFDDFCTRSERQGRAQADFAAFYPDDLEVRRYCEVDVARKAAECGPRGFSYVYNRARKLDAAANLSYLSEGKVDPRLRKELDIHYKLVFSACRSRGVLAGHKVGLS